MTQASIGIATSYIRKMTPDRSWDWCASFENDKPDDDGMMLCGWGATEADAIGDLMGKVTARRLKAS